MRESIFDGGASDDSGAVFFAAPPIGNSPPVRKISAPPVEGISPPTGGIKPSPIHEFETPTNEGIPRTNVLPPEVVIEPEKKYELVFYRRLQGVGDFQTPFHLRGKVVLGVVKVYDVTENKDTFSIFIHYDPPQLTNTPQPQASILAVAAILAALGVGVSISLTFLFKEMKEATPAVMAGLGLGSILLLLAAMYLLKR